MNVAARVVLGSAILMAVAQPCSAQNAVTDWSLKAQNAVAAGRTPASTEYLLALVHAAMYDATVAIEGRYRPFGSRIDASFEASPAAAIATAAYEVLRQRLPALEPGLTADYTAYMATIGDGTAKDSGVAVGTAAARGWLTRRANDGFDNVIPYVQPTPGPGVWEPTAPTTPVDEKLKQVRPYVMRSVDQLRPSGPPRLERHNYARAFDEVYEVGRIDSLVRTPSQTDIARFWSENTAVQWNRNLRQLAIGANLDLVETARMLAMTHVASADALVACFDAKYHFLAWRPVHAIQRADTDGNFRTAPDPGWTPLLNVNHPEYPSAHACFTSAVTDTLAFFFGDDDASVTLDSATTGTTREYSRFSEVAEEVGDARVFAGLHFRFSIDDGSRIGEQAARLVTRHHFKRARKE